MKTKGKFFWKQRWFSICSAHRDHKYDCDMCTTGSWHNVWKLKHGSIIYYFSPRLWVWYMNRPKSKARRLVKSWFPKLN